jgi:hypothetical protein
LSQRRFLQQPPRTQGMSIGGGGGCHTRDVAALATSPSSDSCLSGNRFCRVRVNLFYTAYSTNWLQYTEIACVFVSQEVTKKNSLKRENTTGGVSQDQAP